MYENGIASLFAAAADRAARFREKIRDRPQRPSQDYASSLEAFDEPLPEHSSSMQDALEELWEKAEPGLHMPTGPRFFGWVMGGSHPVGVAADFMASAWGQNAGNHMAAPSAAAAETVAARWLLELLDLPRESSVGFVTGATAANFTCLAAARSSLLRGVGWDADARGLFGAPPITVLIGDDAHTTIFSALQYLGLGHERVERIPTDEDGRIDVGEFTTRLGQLKTQGALILVILQAGQINTGAFDNFDELIPLAKSAGAWVHIDGAFGLWARASVNKRHLATGVERADSWATDGHKWLQVPYDGGYAFVRDELSHRRAMTMSASYLPVASDYERDPAQYVPELSRRARGFATWAVIKHLGRDGVSAIVERNCDAASEMASILSGEPGIEVLNTVALNQIVVSFGGGVALDRDSLTARVIQRIQETGEVFAGGARWKGKSVMRISVTNYLTDVEEGRRAAQSIIGSYRAAVNGG
ncbi:pyridoxal-dependent decarboxylase [Rhizobium sp. 2MFCol3.1]|uniref:pyridoxal phosphate-dependent decarboxylase family protein n=1 Tax=Rhizobium sp. 2MFCol3.1 TaxID=1246459 RepID=UPI00036DA3AB|nr:pyridoxal-dependent decarboxylase [Rhizobium sp. 2MFCol3.1]